MDDNLSLTALKVDFSLSDVAGSEALISTSHSRQQLETNKGERSGVRHKVKRSEGQKVTCLGVRGLLDDLQVELVAEVFVLHALVNQGLNDQHQVVIVQRSCQSKSITSTSPSPHDTSEDLTGRER